MKAFELYYREYLATKNKLEIMKQLRKFATKPVKGFPYLLSH